MNILMINASPKKKNSASGELLSDFKTCFPKDASFTEYRISSKIVTDEIIAYLNTTDILVIAFPLYVDAIPAHLLSCLCQIEARGISNKRLRVYAISNSGFYEGKQNAIALEVMENWCNKAGVIWGQGVGVGGGGGLSQMGSMPLGKGLKKSLGAAFEVMKKNIENNASAENLYVSMDMPRFLYKMAAEMGWRKSIKENGLDVKDLSHKQDGMPDEKREAKDFKPHL